MQQNRRIKWLLIAIVTVMMTACGGGSGTGSNTVPSADPFALTLDVNESTATANWLSASSASDAEGSSLTATVKTQGNYGTFVITGESVSYLKTIETNETDIGVLEISDGTDSVQITLTVNSLYWKQISAGEYHTAALKSDGTIWSWGENDDGQLGDGTTNDKYRPTQENSTDTHWIAVAAGASHTVALKSDGTIWSWGDNNSGQLGDNSTDEKYIPTQENSADTHWSTISAGGDHTIALKSDGTLWAWGNNSSGLLGNDSTNSKHVPTQESSADTHWSAISTGYYHTVALKSDGTLWAWGRNRYGQLGNDSDTDKHVPTQEESADNHWSAISVGYYHTVALKSDGTLWAWGRNSSGQLGDNSSDDKLVPTQENSADTHWSAISAGYYHTVAQKSDHTLWAWGENASGQLGNDTTDDMFVPTQESSTDVHWGSISAGYYHTVALKNDGTLWAWGGNQYGQLGNGSTSNILVPTQESTVSTYWRNVSVGESHTIAIKSDGTLWSWGDNYYGQLGDGSTTSKHAPTQESTFATNWSTISAGYFHTVAIKSDGTLWAWGRNHRGQLGINSTGEKHVPTQESSADTHWIAVAASSSHTVALKDNHTLWAWGSNFSGQLGNGTTDEKHVPTQESSADTHWIAVAASSSHTVALKDDHTLWAWGSNFSGQLGNGTTDEKHVPTQESSADTHWSAISAGYSHTVALKDDHTLWAWGSNHFGQLGNGTTDEKHVPTQENSADRHWSAISAGKESHTIALKDDHTLWVWGSNHSGQLGNGTTDEKHVPTQESTHTDDWSVIAAGRYHTIALKNDDTLWGWGSNYSGQLTRASWAPSRSQPRVP